MSKINENLVNDQDLFISAKIKLDDLGIDLIDAVEDYFRMIINSDNNQLLTIFKSRNKNKKNYERF